MRDFMKSRLAPVNTTLVEQLMKEEKKQVLLHAPQYESWIQPIELVWAWTKHRVAEQAIRGRSVAATK